jgi:glycosyltransferase involved in cell wall biosynthesis
VVGEAGIPYRDEQELAEQLQRVLRDGSLVSAYRQRAQARVQQYYDWERVIDRYENLFAEMANRPAPHPDKPTFEQPADAYGQVAARRPSAK